MHKKAKQYIKIENSEKVKIEPDSPLILKKPQIGDFSLQEIIGIGNFGKVHKAYNNRDQHICALKVLVKENVLKMK